MNPTYGSHVIAPPLPTANKYVQHRNVESVTAVDYQQCCCHGY